MMTETLKLTVNPFGIGLDSVLAYWDEDSCGSEGKNANWQWCKEESAEKIGIDACNETVFTPRCPSGAAKLYDFRQNYTLNNCYYIYRAEYACTGIFSSCL